MGLILRSGIVYTLATAGISAAYALVVAGAAALYAGSNPAGNPWLTSGFFLGVAVVFVPLQTRIQKGVDRVLDRTQHRYREVLQSASRRIAAPSDIEGIAALLAETGEGVLQAVHCTLALDRNVLHPSSEAEGLPTAFATLQGRTLFGADTPLSRRLEERFQPVLRRRWAPAAAGGMDRHVEENLQRMDAEAALPLGADGRLRGVVLLGRRVSGRPYGRQDIQLMETLVNQAGVAVEHAIVHRKLRHLNDRLEGLVEERTAALQTALEEKERSQERLVRSESLAAIGQLVAGVAHELNNPLAAAISLLQSVNEDLEDPEGSPPVAEIQEDLRFVAGQLDRTRRIVSSLLGLSRQNRDDAESVDLHTVIRDALRVLHNEIKHSGVAVREVFCPDLPPIRGNFAQMGQVVLNLVRNAVQAVPAATGEVTVTTAFERSGPAVTVSVRDNGRGVPPAIRGEIFRPFFTTKPAGEGTGLGLYISHELARKHGGSLTLVDNEGRKGAELVLRVPVA
jgi:two-component system NtrC family sensor kinase